jgi:TolB-like protein/Flp pilus assembly protein TadD
LARYALDAKGVTTPSLHGAGTPGYMAPEQLEGRELTPAADVYAFGVVACEVLTGRRPSEGGLERLPARWQQPIRKAVDPDPARRGARLPGPVSAARRGAPFLSGGLVLVVAALSLFWFRARLQAEPWTVAVLPFVQESGTAEDQYFGEGLSDEIIAALSRTPSLSVIARNSSSRFTDSKLEYAEVARRLHARYLIAGAIRFAGNRLQASAQLIDPHTSAILWSRTFERDRSQTVALHAEIARGVASRLGIRLASAQLSAFDSQSPRQDAVELYSRGRALWASRGPRDLHEALDAFDQAIAVDPNFAAAYAARADTLAIMAEGSYLSGATALPQAKEAALRALILDPQLPEAQAALGLVQSIGEWDFYNAERSLQRSLDLSPSYVYAHQWLAAVLLKTGRAEEAIREAETAIRLDPLAPAAVANLGWMYFYSQRFDAALQVADAMSRDYPQFPYICLLRTDPLIGKGSFGPALQALSGCSAEVKETSSYLRSLAVAQALSGRRPAAIDTLNRMIGMRAREPVAESRLAAVYASLGFANDAFYWLDQGIIQRDPSIALVDVSPFFAPIRSDSRYAEMLARIGLPHRK